MITRTSPKIVLIEPRLCHTILLLVATDWLCTSPLQNTKINDIGIHHQHFHAPQKQGMSPLEVEKPVIHPVHSPQLVINIDLSHTIIVIVSDVETKEVNINLLT